MSIQETSFASKSDINNFLLNFWLEMACRLCLVKIEDMLDPEFYTSGDDKQLMKLVKKFFGFEVSHDTSFSQIVCKYCSEKIKSFNGYCEEVQDNQKKLLETKNKVIDKDDDDSDVVPEPEIFVKEEVFTQSITTADKQKGVKWDYDKISKFMKFSCKNCVPEKRFKNCIQWKKHMKESHGNASPVHTCCGVKLICERSILMHINKVHDPPKKLPPFQCAICLKRFKHKARIIIHMRVHQNMHENVYQCKKCPQTFFKSVHWQSHQLSHDPSLSLAQILYPCKKCPLEFATCKLAKAHLRNDHKKKFLCDLCAEVFHVKFLLQEHIRMVHASENPRQFKCPHCDGAFLRKNNLTNHIQLMHTETGRFPCDKCDKVAITEKQLMNHIKYTHELNRNFICMFCQKAFKRRCDLVDHESIHTGKPLHKCPKCERMFNSKSNMQSHSKRCKGTLVEN